MRKQKRHVQKFWDISTGHVTQKDTELLTAGETNVVAYEYDYGYFVHVSEDVDGAIVEKEGFSREFAKIWDEARKAKYEFIRLDQDGAECGDLRAFDW